jgi:hypothetical protein
MVKIGDEVKGFVDQNQIDLFGIDLDKGDRVQLTMNVTDGDLKPQLTMYLNASEHIKSDNYTAEGQLLTKVYSIAEKSRYYLVARAYQGSGSGHYSLKLECLEGPCHGDVMPPDPLDLFTTSDCIKRIRECAFSQLSTELTKQESAKAIWDQCVASTTAVSYITDEFVSCKNACSEHQVATDLCNSIVNLIPFYAEKGKECADAFTYCVDLCYEAEGDSGIMEEGVFEEEFPNCTENICTFAGFNGNCDNYARNYSLCGGTEYEEETKEECYAFCEATTGAWIDDLDTLCDDRCASM